MGFCCLARLNEGSLPYIKLKKSRAVTAVEKSANWRLEPNFWHLEAAINKILPRSDEQEQKKQMIPKLPKDRKERTQWAMVGLGWPHMRSDACPIDTRVQRDAVSSHFCGHRVTQRRTKKWYSRFPRWRILYFWVNSTGQIELVEVSECINFVLCTMYRTQQRYKKPPFCWKANFEEVAISESDHQRQCNDGNDDYGSHIVSNYQIFFSATEVDICFPEQQRNRFAHRGRCSA